MMRVLLVATLVPGCANVFGLTTDHGPPDAPTDAAEIDAPIDAAPCTLPKVTLPLLEDAEMISDISAQNQGHGLEAILNIGVAEAILKFDATNLPPNTQRFTLTLPAVEKSNDCSTACGSCLALDRSGTLRVAYLRSDWAEATANYLQRSAGNAWQAAGANGVNDRGPLQGMATFTATSPLPPPPPAITFPATGVATWVAPSTQQLSLVVSPFDGATIIIRQRHAWTQQCMPVPVAPTLIADPCPPPK